MKNPGHPGSHIREELAFLGWSVTDAARALGVTRQHLNNVISGRSAITPDMAMRLEKGIGGTADSWLRLQVAFDIAAVRARADEFAVERLTARLPAE
jgi:addiction module HigA family antidote